MMYPVVLPGAAVQALSPSLRRSLRLFFSRLASFIAKKPGCARGRL
ncbi:hypothetical protein LMG31841_00916 [Paraburkholderia saeva]|uniref:Uncharacterized protein n=1 Tax=Paraburkholderia saeva TaxID=2777537 RepID=A0A9N8X0R3_9BURK|nr:hypothetical protein LMG31841_00916 [Paraburkholderia saeva]